MKWQVNFRIFRYKQDGSQPHFDTYRIEASQTNTCWMSSSGFGRSKTAR